jgi:hypothetical protein
MRKLILLSLLLSNAVFAQPPMVLKAQANLKTNQLFDIAVTVRHPDSGWDHYANEWIAVDGDGNEIAKRTLYHPHVNEQPFTRYARDVVIPVSLNKVIIMATCNHGHVSKPYVLIDKKQEQ